MSTNMVLFHTAVFFVMCVGCYCCYVGGVGFVTNCVVVFVGVDVVVVVHAVVVI